MKFTHSVKTKLISEVNYINTPVLIYDKKEFLKCNMLHQGLATFITFR